MPADRILTVVLHKQTPDSLLAFWPMLPSESDNAYLRHINIGEPTQSIDGLVDETGSRTGQARQVNS